MVTLYYITPEGEFRQTDNFFIDAERNIESDKNTFELVVNTAECSSLCVGSMIYIPDIMAAGQIKGFQHDTKTNVTRFTGPTLYGLLANQVLAPRAGADYFTTNSTASGSVMEVLERFGFTKFQKGAINSTPVGLYQYERYTDGLSAISKMLASINHRLYLSFDDVFDLYYDEYPILTHDIYSDMFEFEIKKNACINHMVGLGRGELRYRQVVHRYMDIYGNVSSSIPAEEAATWKDNEIVGTYDYSNAGSLAELEKGTEDKLTEQSLYEIKITPKNITMEVGDKVEGYIEIGNQEIFVSQKVKKMIITVERGVINRQYEVG